MANPNPSPSTRVSKGERLCDPDEKLSPLAQIRRMQRVLFNRTQAKGTEDKVISAIACAWERLEGRKAILTMRPAPKPIDVSPRVKQRRPPQSASPCEDAPAPKPTIPQG